jgi:hypothetical protein
MSFSPSTLLPSCSSSALLLRAQRAFCCDEELGPAVVVGPRLDAFRGVDGVGWDGSVFSKMACQLHVIATHFVDCCTTGVQRQVLWTFGGCDRWQLNVVVWQGGCDASACHCLDVVCIGPSCVLQLI